MWTVHNKNTSESNQSILFFKESWAPKNWCFWTVVLEKILEVFLQPSPLGKKIQAVHLLGVHWKDWCWSWNCNTLATWWEELTHLKRSWCWERLRAGGEGGNRRWDGWMASLTRVWEDCGSWWRIGKTSMLRFMGHKEPDTTEQLNWTELILFLGFHGGSDGKESACNAGDPGLTRVWDIGKISWKREWLPTLAFLPGEFYEQRNLEAYSPWCHKELNTRLSTHTFLKVTITKGKYIFRTEW